MISAHPNHLDDTVIKKRYRLCPSCGHFVLLSDDDIFCIVCGEKLIEVCPRCHEPIIYPIARFCPACGDRLVNSNPPKN